MNIDSQFVLLQFLDNEEIQLFSSEQIRQETGIGVSSLNKMIERLVQKGFLVRLERGKYCRSTFRDENAIGTFLAYEGAIAYWSALNQHGLTEQFPNKIFVQTTKTKKEVTVSGTTYQFIKITSQKQSGVMHQGFGNHRYAITDVEKTIVDCFDLPQYSGGYAELLRAFAKATLNAEKLIEYCMAIHNFAAIKRMGFLAELLGKKNLSSFVEYARRQANRTYNLFDPFGSEQGKPVSEWYLRLNLSEESILHIIQSAY